MKILNILFYLITCILAFIASGCSSDDGGPAPTDTSAPIAKLNFVNNSDGAIVSVIGKSSLGTIEYFVITSTDANDDTPNIIEKGEVGVVEITEYDALWELSYSMSFSTDPLDIDTAVFDMQIFSCDAEYMITCDTQTFDFFGEETTVSSCILNS